MRVYGPTVNHWRCYLDYVTSEDETSLTVQVVAAGMQSVAWGFEISSGIDVWVAVADQEARHGSGGFSSGSGQTAEKSFVSATYAVTKGTAAQSVTVRASCTNSSGYMNGTSECQAVLAVAQRPSYVVTYDANGGNGAPTAQTKWYGMPLELSSMRPTRSGHTFLGWATSASGAAEYQPGVSYAEDADLALYAAWRADYLAPSISGLFASRCGASGEADADGASMRVRCSYAARQTGNRVTQVKVEYKLSTASLWTQAYSASPNAASGTLDAVCGGSLDPDAVYDVRVTVSDAGGSSTALTRLPGRSVALHFGRQGAGAAFFKRVSRDGLDVGGLAWLGGGQSASTCVGTNGQAGYFRVCTVRIGGPWAGTPLQIVLVRRTDNVATLLSLRWTHADATDPTLMGLYWAGGCGDAWLCRAAAGEWDLYVAKGTASDALSVLAYLQPGTNAGHSVEWHDDQVASLPSGAVRARPARASTSYMTLNSAYGVYASRGPDGTVAVYSRGASALPAGAQWTQVALGTLPEGWRPPCDAMQAVPCGGGTVYLGVTTAGAVSYTRATPTQSADGVYATLCYPAQG